MKNKSFDFVNNVYKSLIVYIGVIIIGIVFTCINGLSLDINFKGGTRFIYSFEGEIEINEAQSVIEDVLKQKVTVSENTALSGDSKKLVVSLVADDSVSAELQQKATETLQKKYADNKIELYDSNSVSASVANNFFIKSLVAVTVAGAFVLLYVSIRFKKIGGFSAGIMALLALVLDIAVAFITCGIFRLDIDANFIAVVLTILGYSLNDTIVIYDRIRENSVNNKKMAKSEIVNTSLNQVLTRTITTSVTTIVAVLVIIAVSEYFGLTTLRSFAIPMFFGLISGSCSSIFISAPLWLKWQERKAPAKKK